MKAIILAAGLGSRLGGMTEILPKGMLEFKGKPLIQWQIDALRAGGVNDIVIVTGHCAECIDFPGVTLVHNSAYATTNMLESLMCARDYLDDGFLLSYADIVYEPGLVSAMLESPVDIGVAADIKWPRYWTMRFGTPEFDLESFSVDQNGNVLELGLPAKSSKGLTHRYVGLLKFSPEGVRQLIEAYETRKADGSPWEQSGKEFLQGYMTDILDYLIKRGRNVNVIETVNGWMEFDEPGDFELAEKLAQTGSLGTIGNFDKDELLAQKKALVFEFAQYGDDTIKTFVCARRAAAKVMGVTYQNAPPAMEKVVESLAHNWRSGAQRTLGWDGYFTTATLGAAVERLVADPEDAEAIKVIDLLQQRFEVTKALFSIYVGAGLRKGFGPYKYAVDYFLLAMGLALRFASDNNYNYMNTLLKVNDLLLSDTLEGVGHYSSCLTGCLSAEASILGLSYDLD